MSLSDLASIGSLVSGIAVLISLVYLGQQVRQAERNQQASIRDSRATRIANIFMATTEPSLADAIEKCSRGDADVSDTQVRQFMAYTVARLIHVDEAYHQHKEGLLNEAAFNQLGRPLRLQLSSPGGRAMYTRLRGAFGDEFVAYADNMVASTPLGFAVDIVPNFKTDVATQLARARD